MLGMPYYKINYRFVYLIIISYLALPLGAQSYLTFMPGWAPS